MSTFKIHNGDCLEVLRNMPDNSVDSICTDPPYGISFMSKKWDYDVPSIDVWRECLRVLKPGGHMLVACGTRTQHRMVAPIEDAGFEIRDVITWLYGSGMPKGFNFSNRIPKEEWCDCGESEGVREPRGTLGSGALRGRGACQGCGKLSQAFQGFDVGIKPAVEFWTLCRKPLSESTVAKNVLKWGTGAINVDDARAAFEAEIAKDSVWDLARRCYE